MDVFSTEKILISLCRIFFGIYIPGSFRTLRGKAILHLSDTPSTFYPGISRLIRFLEPPCIVHTGDLADEVKLGIVPGDLPRYRRKLGQLAGILGGWSSGRLLIIVTGNHDDEDSVREFFPSSRILPGKGRESACGLEMNLSHDLKDLAVPPARFNLYGHDPSLPDRVEGNAVFLNGLHGIHFISVDTGEVLRLAYPAFVEDGRLARRKTGL